MTRCLVGLMWAGLLLTGTSAVHAMPCATGAAASGLPDHIRVTDRRLAVALSDGMRRSPTLRALADRVGELNGIVYVVTAVRVWTGTNHSLQGALSHQVTVAGDRRILRITVTHDYSDSAIATIAHELRHAIEVLEDPGVRTTEDVDALFERIGTRVSAGVAETGAASEVQRMVAEELRARRGGGQG